MPYFSKKPVVIQAVQFKIPQDYDQVCRFVHKELTSEYTNTPQMTIVISTLEGEMRANLGDWIICGINGEFYPCKPDIFEKTYNFNHD